MVLADDAAEDVEALKANTQVLIKALDRVEASDVKEQSALCRLLSDNYKQMASLLANGAAANAKGQVTTTKTAAASSGADVDEKLPYHSQFLEDLLGIKTVWLQWAWCSGTVISLWYGARKWVKANALMEAAGPTKSNPELRKELRIIWDLSEGQLKMPSYHASRMRFGGVAVALGAPLLYWGYLKEKEAARE